MAAHTRSVAKKFWNVFPMMMRTIFAESRRGANNLAPNHFRVLGALSARNCNVSELAEHQNVSLPSMSATIQTLVERGWLERDRSSDDRREINLHMTEEGRRVLASEHRRLTEWVAAKMEDLDETDVKRVERALDILLRLFEESQAKDDQKEISMKT